MAGLHGLRVRSLPGLRHRWLVGGAVHVLELDGRGSLPPVLLVHGLGSNAVDYVPLMARLRNACGRVWSVDLPGHGQSPAPAAGMDPDLVRAVAMSAVRELIDEPALVFGNSLGGLAAVRLALDLPDQVRGLVLASPGGTPMPAPDLAAFMGGFLLKDHRSAVQFVDAFTGRPHPLRSAFAWGVRARMARPETVELVRRITARHMLTAQDLASVRPPTVLVWGRQDDVMPVSHRQFYLDNLAQLVRVSERDGYGHAPYMDDLTGFSRELCDHLEMLAGVTGG